MPADNAPTFKVEDAQLLFRNFSGEERRFNDKGDRNFSVVLSKEAAVQMEDDGWNVKYLEPREEGDEPVPYIKVSVNFDNRPPRIELITSTTRTPLTDETVGILDFADIRLVDLIARGYRWEVGDKMGVKAYLKTMFVTIEEDDLERKYGVSASSQPNNNFNE